MKSELSIQDAIKKLAGNKKVNTIAARVISTDSSKGTALVEIELFELELTVRLTPFEVDNPKKCLLVVPKKDTYVLLQRVEESDEFFMLRCSEVDEIFLGGDQYSLANTEKLINQLLDVKLALQGIMKALTTSAILAGDGGATYKNNIVIAIQNIKTGDFRDMENTKVKHG